METSIITQIARKVFLNAANVPKELQDNKRRPAVEDSVSLSKDALAFQKSVSGASEFDKARETEVKRLKSLIESNKYQMSSEIIDKIADKIASMLV